MRVARAIVVVFTVVVLAALFVSIAVARTTGDGMTEQEGDAIVAVFAPLIVVAMSGCYILSDEPVKRRRR